MKQIFIIETKKGILQEEILGCLEDTIENEIISVQELIKNKELIINGKNNI